MASSASKQKGHDLDDVPASGGRKDRVKPGDIVDVYEVPTKWGRIRLFGRWYLYGGHWVNTITREKKKATFFTSCLAFDSETGKRDGSKHCPWCSHDIEGDIRFSVDYWSNGIVRGLQRQAPERLPKPTKKELETGLKEKDSESWTPVRAVRLPAGPIRDIKDARQLNVHEDENGDSVAYPVTHPKFGCDIMLKKDPDAAPAKRYSFNKSDHSPITKAERAYLIYDLTELQTPDTPEEADSEYASWMKRMHPEKAGSKKRDEDEDESPKKKAKRPVVDDDEDEDTPPRKKKVVVDDEDEDPPPRKKKAVVDDEDEDPPPRKKAKRPVVDDDDEDEPPPKKKAVVDDEDEDPPPRKKKPVVDEDEDEPPPKKAKRPVVDDDDEDEPPPKKKSKKPVVDDDDDDL